ncbi:ferredoxin [Methanosarcina sp. 1.H.T.1A.1]|jgi:3-phenylpropionate/trans-cinnamate dioxygenase ferredoxin subunit|nr:MULTISPECIES: Rieske (2Fe-2S) protein [unclassified Methanosarcina]KKH50607.1 ferredoxin [Methanosarcina sp. 1.H.A.2.2]KKH97026.1 ferredoxin [Methanosarcina sp. 1.H.T.1A.1]
MPSEKVPEKGSISGFEPPWFYAAEESSLKEGKLLHVEPGGRNVLLLKAEGQIHAFSNLCPHARCPMDRGRLEEFTLTCLCHGRRFDVRTGKCLNDSLELKRYEWKLEGGRIGVKIEE